MPKTPKTGPRSPFDPLTAASANPTPQRPTDDHRSPLMRTLTNTLRTLRDRLDGDSPQSPGGFGAAMPPAPRLRARQTPADDVPIGVDVAGQPVSIPRDKHVLI